MMQVRSQIGHPNRTPSNAFSYKKLGNGYSPMRSRSRTAAVTTYAKKFVFLQRKKIESLEKVRNHLKGQPGIEDFQEVPFFEMTKEGETKVIGREKESKYSDPKLVINAPTVSADHAKLSIIDGSLYAQDLDSFNGTKINGRNLKVDKEYFIKHGTVLSFGDDFLARYQMFEKDDEWDFEGSDEEEIAAQDEIENAVILQQMSDAASGSAEGTPPPPTAEQEVGSVAAEAQTANEKDCSCCD